MISSLKKKPNKWSDFPLKPELLKGLKENGFEQPLPIQVKSLKAALLDGKNIFGAARTGSGKTLAYAIPLLHHILSMKYSFSSSLKAKIRSEERKKEDFELIGDELVSVEDMIVDKFMNSVDDEDNKSDIDCDDVHEDGTGSGCSLSDNEVERTCPETIILVPTRELAFQVKQDIDKITIYTDINTCCLVGGLNQDKQLRRLRKLKPQIVIATPGRLFDIVQSDVIEYLNIQSVASISRLVIDEADRMIQKGHFEEMLKIVDMVKESRSFRRDDELSYKVYLYSATLTFLHELPSRLKNNPLATKESRSNGSKNNKVKKHMDLKEHNKKNKIKQMLELLGINRSETSIIDLNDEHSFGRPSSDQLSEFKINCVERDKDLHLYYFLYGNPKKKILIFCNSKTCLRRLSNVLKFLGYSTLKLHSDMDQKKRLSNLEQFRSKPDAILIATDIAARGLDIKNLDCVIHYQVPRTCESYIHRSGRTARLNQKGVSLTLCEPKEVPSYRRLCNNINQGKDLTDYELDVKLRSKLKERVDLAIQCDKLDHNLRESNSNRNWFIKAASDCDIELDNEDLRILGGRGKSKEQNLEDDSKKKRQLIQLEKRLKNMMKKPIKTREMTLTSYSQILDVN